MNQLPGFLSIVGRSPALLKVLEMSARIATRQTPVLIIGESGTGKNLLARAIHQNSSARDGSFTKIACGLLGSTSTQSSLYPAASHAAITLYLEDVTELPPHLQVELTELMGHAESSGSGDAAQTAIRVIASTSLQGNLVTSAKLRPDLYYRLSVVPLHVPPLRERKEDLPALVDFFAGRLARRHNLTAISIPKEVGERFAHYHWPGNVRELENVVERMLLLAADFEFSEDDEDPNSVTNGDTAVGSFAQGLPENGLSLGEMERNLLIAALAKFGGNQTKAARYLNISRRTLIYRMGKYKLRGDGGPEHD